MNEIRKIAVVGSGVMGRGLAQLLCQSGLQVTLVNRNPASLASARDEVGRRLARLVERGNLTAEQRDAALDRVETAQALAAAASADLVIEAVYERLHTKTEVLQGLHEACPAETIIATNTSSFSITLLGALSGRPERLIGLHFFNPAPLMQLVEIVRGQATSDETFQTSWQFVERLGKTPVAVGDSAGFITNRLLFPMFNEAALVLAEGLATREAVDTAMKLGANHPMGPLELADLVGLDVCLQILEHLHEELGDKYRPSPLLRRLVAAGHLGRKTRQGFYSY
ncbi:MAG: NAD(P)-binding domain-containing protein [Chloroflexi bacterium]|nr:NAD(P)-binding domain-containing protein [Chloroflexota bacterium]